MSPYRLSAAATESCRALSQADSCTLLTYIARKQLLEANRRGIQGEPKTHPSITHQHSGNARAKLRDIMSTTDRHPKVRPRARTRLLQFPLQAGSLSRCVSGAGGVALPYPIEIETLLILLGMCEGGKLLSPSALCRAFNFLRLYRQH